MATEPRAPMRGKRVKAARCPVEGHQHCELAMAGEPPSRVTEKAAWKSDVEVTDDAEG